MTDSIDNHSNAVARARMPYTDRRSLSQAWFSALHLAQMGRAPGLPARRASDPLFLETGAHVAVARKRAEPPALPQATSRAAKIVRTESREGMPAGRLRDVRVSAKDKAAFERARSYPPFTTSLTVGVDGARIKLLLRREGPILHVIALCAPGSTELVRRALACADSYLRQRGESVRASVGTLDESAL